MRSLVLVATLALGAPALATTYTLEPNYTQVVFRWDHLGYSLPAAQIAQGKGMLEFDAMQPTMASVEVSLPLSTIASGVPELDERLKSADFFEVTRFPTATFASTKVEKSMDADRLRVTGNLTLHGVTKSVTLDVTLLKTGSNPRTKVATVGFNATARIKRTDFGLGAFVPQVGDDVTLQITAQGAESKGYAAFLKEKEGKK